jgi:hypothetical protein
MIVDIFYLKSKIKKFRVVVCSLEQGLYPWPFSLLVPSEKINHFIAIPNLKKKKKFRTVLFWAIMHPAVVIPYRRFRTTYWSHLQGGPIGCHEMSKSNYHYTLCNCPEERSFHPLHDRSLNSHNEKINHFFLYCTLQPVHNYNIPILIQTLEIKRQ